MTNGQIAQLQELSKCYGFSNYDNQFVHGYAGGLTNAWMRYTRLAKYEKAQLRRLAHQYRHQIKAMRRNRK